MSSTFTETAQVTPLSLKEFLVAAPQLYKTKLSREAEKLVLTTCYRALWNNDLELMQKYFFKEGLLENEKFSQLLERHHLFRTSKQDLGQEDEPEYWESQRGKQCGHLFKKGESVYRCRNCGLDDTCVMCSKCFQATNHDDHDVKIWISKGAGGCCDCGDPEAWKIPLNCKIHSADASVIPQVNSTIHTLDPLDSVPDSLLGSVRETIAVVLDYILETFATSLEDVISSPRDVGTSVTMETITQDCIDSHKALDIPVDIANQTYACILWNDEKHSFDQVIGTVREATGCSHEEAAHAAECVDIYGRYVIKESRDIEELIQIAKTISSIHLAVTICSTHKTTREDIAGLLLDWLKELTGGRYKFFDGVEGGNCIIRDFICQGLSEDWALKPDLAALSTRCRRTRMPEDEDDEFDEGGDGGDEDMDEDGNGLIFDEDDMEEINEDMLLDEAGIDEFFNIVNSGDEDEDYHDIMVNESEEDSSQEYTDAEGSIEDVRADTEELSNVIRPAQMETDSQPLTNNHTITSPWTRRRSSQTPANTSSSAAAELAKRRRLSASDVTKGNKSHKTRDILDMDWNLDQWLEYTEELESEERLIATELRIPYDADNDTMATSRNVNENLKKEFRRKLRLDYLLQFDLRLWKTARISIKDLLIGTFISNFDYRPVIGKRYVRNYPELVDAFFFKDREPENSISTLSVQLLTVPTVAALLVKEYKFFGIVCSILQNFFLTDSIHMLLPDSKGYAGAQVDSTARAIGRHRYAYTIFDLRYVMNAEQVRLEISKNPIYLRQFLDMMYQFQAMDPLKRQVNTHVEYENASWVAAFNMTLQTSKSCRLFADCFEQTFDISMTEASRNLCRCIYRVLKAISSWDPHLAPRKEEQQQLIDNRMIIKGLMHQKFHDIVSPNAGTFSIVDYNVAENPISFHHPFHWLLSELFEHVSLLNDGVLHELGWLGGFQQMVNDAFVASEHDKFLMVLDYPIRSLAVLSQINCGVWVRNGYTIRDMSQTYKDVSVRTNTLDCDIYLLQVGFAVCHVEQLLLTLMDRFQLTDWFIGKQNRKSVYDANQKTFMVEDFLNLLITCATEHGYASGATTEALIHQSIIQYLGIGSLAHSELVNLIPENLHEHESFEAQLGQLANFKAPDGLSDKGLYELKPEYIQEINPYFWHYTRNQREEAHNVLKKRWNQLHPDNKLGDKEEFLLMPPTKKIEKGPFRHLGNFLHSHTLVQILVYTLWDSKLHNKSDTILDEALYLGMLAVTDKNSAASELASMQVKGKYRADYIIDQDNTSHFMDYAVTDKYSIQVNEIEKSHETLLVVLLRCLDDVALQHAHKRLEFILDKIDAYVAVDSEAKERISEWKDRKQKQIKAAMKTQGGEVSDYERKKAAAKARQAAIMSQFANAQSKFMEKHSDLYKTEEDVKEMEDSDLLSIVDESTEVVRKCHFPTDTCIVCQEALDDSKLFGSLCLVQKATIQRLAEMDNKDILVDVLDTANQSQPWAPREDTSNGPTYVGFPTEAHRSGLDISSCGHMMHSECFDSYQKSVDSQLLGELSRMFPLSLSPKSRFLCPLCKALGNVLVPVVWKGKKESYPGVMVPQSPYAELSQHIKETMEHLKKKIEHIPGSFDEEPAFVNKDPDLVICDQEKLKLIYNKLMKVIHATITDKPYEASLNLFNSVEDLQDMYSYTITDFEIAQRGTEGTRARDLTVEHTGTFIDDVSSTSQTLLKILGLTNLLIPKLMDSPWQSEVRFTGERLAVKSLKRLIPDKQSGDFYNASNATDVLPILIDDPFKTLVRTSFSVHDYPAIEIHHLLRSVYLAELAKCVIALVRYILQGNKVVEDEKVSGLLNALNTNQQNVVGAESLQQFANYVLGLLSVPQATIDRFFTIVHPGAFAALVRTFSLPFLRKSLLFMVVQHGFIPQRPTDESNKNEYENLLAILRLPMLDDMASLAPFEHELISGWCTDYIHYSKSYSASHDQLSALGTIKLNLPTVFKMAHLPYRLDQLLDESSKRVCRKCKTVPEHSAICLICGTFVCARRFCCNEGTKGECNTHMKTCGGEIGIYLIIKDCFLLLLHDNGGSIMNAPYLDSHGEADVFLKRGTPQYLNAKRYEQIRQMWLNQSIPAFVRRKMEVAQTPTIWEAF